VGDALIAHSQPIRCLAHEMTNRTADESQTLPAVLRARGRAGLVALLAGWLGSMSNHPSDGQRRRGSFP
jgi:hypothetical protein